VLERAQSRDLLEQIERSESGVQREVQPASQPAPRAINATPPITANRTP
jgi:hypothetical protein